MQYLGYCTVCNTSNPSRSFNPTVPYLDTSPVQAGNPCALLFSFQFSHFELQNSFRLSHFNRLSLSHSQRSTLSTSTLSASPSTPSSSLPVYPTQTHKKKQRKNGTRDRDPQTRAPFLDPDQRESKGWGLERIGCLSENLMLFRPR